MKNKLIGFQPCRLSEFLNRLGGFPSLSKTETDEVVESGVVVIQVIFLKISSAFRSR